MDRDRVVEYLALMTDAEFTALTAEARAPKSRDVKALILDELKRLGEPL